MNTARCSICRRRFPKLKLLYIHYLKFHSKTKIIGKLLEQNSRQVLFKSPRKCTKKYARNKCKGRNEITKIKTYETESFILRENIRIFCGDNEIISIGDDKQDVKLSFNNQSEDHCYLTWNKLNRKCKKLTNKKTNKPTCKRKTKKKKTVKQRKKEECHINITRLQDTISLDDQTGEFYTCHCRETDFLHPGKFQTSDIRLITSDTESCSETSKNSCVSPEGSKLFCNKCGSGYKTEAALTEHMFVHEPFCRLCNTWFPNEYDFRKHMQLHKIKFFACHICGAEFSLKDILIKHFDYHLENKVLEDVLDMEEDYTSFQTNFLNNNYGTSTSLNSIMCFLKDRPDAYYCNYKFMKTVCGFCYKEIFLDDYEKHLQIFHTYSC